jgi:hypothetical protein
VIEVRVAENDRVNLRGVERKGVGVARLVSAPTLDQAAVEQHLATSDVQDVTGTGDLGGSAEKLEFH